jgi:hypothetical protein
MQTNQIINKKKIIKITLKTNKIKNKNKFKVNKIKIKKNNHMIN